MAQQQQQQQQPIMTEPELAGARPLVPLGHVVEAAARRAQEQYAQVAAELPMLAPDARCARGCKGGRSVFVVLFACQC
jgi:hypothetical protein